MSTSSGKGKASPFRPCFSPGTLFELARLRTESALAAEALEPILTHRAPLHQGGRRWDVRVVDSLARKEYLRRALSAEGRSLGPPEEQAFNPFLPYDEELYVADINRTHVVLLNKYKVIENHLLVVTRRFVDQQELLDQDDFVALQRCMREFDGLAFYNGGEAAGASQRHKHLQLIPLSPDFCGDTLPLVPSVPEGRRDGPYEHPDLPWVHGVVSLRGWLDDEDASRGPGSGPVWAFRQYRRLVEHIGVASAKSHCSGQQGPYNLLLTSDVMWAVPRSREFCDGVSINALGFAGALLVQTPEQLERLRKRGPLEALRHVSLARSSSALPRASTAEE